MSGSSASFDLSANRAAAVLAVLERAQVPPLPVFYKLLFDYVAGVRGLMASQVGNILAQDNSTSGSLGEKLYAEFVAPYENRQPLEHAVAQMVRRLGTIDQLIGESAKATHEHSESLRNATAELTGEIDTELLRDWVLRLEVCNQRMKRSNVALTDELDVALDELEDTRAQISRSRESVLRDPLTGIANRGGLDTVVQQLVKSANGEPISCAVIDIDHFKSLNDSYGHQVGDKVLLIVTRVLLASARGNDIVGRTGGDEFVVIFPGTGLSAAHNVAEGIRGNIINSDLSAAIGADVLGGVTISVGVAQYADGESIASLFDRSDKCLYRAKLGGRNRVNSVAEDIASRTA